MEAAKLAGFSRVRHSINDFPSVRFHFPCDEKSGLSVTDEVNGLSIDVSDPLLLGSADYSLPHAISLKRSAAGIVPASIPWPVFSKNRYIFLFLCCRPKMIGGISSGLMPGGSNSAGEALMMGTRQGLHSAVTDLNGNTVSFQDSGGLDETHQTTAGEDALLLLIYRPAGQQIECRKYNGLGALDWSNSYINTPGVLNSDLQQAQSAGMLFDETYPEDSGFWHQSAVYQHIAYEFTAEPSDLSSAVYWHALAPRTGQKSPYPGWRNKT